jgi:hypothetical protein
MNLVGLRFCCNDFGSGSDIFVLTNCTRHKSSLALCVLKKSLSILLQLLHLCFVLLYSAYAHRKFYFFWTWLSFISFHINNIGTKTLRIKFDTDLVLIPYPSPKFRELNFEYMNPRTQIPSIIVPLCLLVSLLTESEAFFSSSYQGCGSALQ